MKLKDLYELAIKAGIEKDPRPREDVQRVLDEAKKSWEESKPPQREVFDLDSLENPYADTRILVGDGNREVKRVLTGIDIGVGEVLLAECLAGKGKPVDLLLSHHPAGRALARLYQVMPLQQDFMAAYGIPINLAEGVLADRIQEVRRGLLPQNHNRVVDAARLLDYMLMCVHTPADNHVTTYLQEFLNREQPETVGEIVDTLMTLPEYKEAAKLGVGPQPLDPGSGKLRAGKIVVEMTGGTGGSPEMFAQWAKAGIGTLVCMHLSEKNRKAAKENHIRIVIAGHIASDSLGMNLFLDNLSAAGIDIIPCSGLLRVERNGEAN